MTKHLPTDGIVNELTGSSVFFPQAVKDGAPAPRPVAMPVTQAEMHGLGGAMPPPTLPLVDDTAPKGHPADDHAAVGSRHHDTMATRDREIVAETHQTSAEAALLEEVRKAAKQFGKEAATHRFTAAEKRAVADIVYTYGCQGLKTSENEITRIAVNWLLLDYHQRGALSVLAQLLDSLHG